MDQYMLHTIAAVILEVAHLATGVALCLLGKSLLEKGIRADFFGEGEVASKKIRLMTSSPGIIFLLAGLVVITATVFTQSEFTQSSVEPGPSSSAAAERTQMRSRMLGGAATSQPGSQPARSD